MAPPTPARPAHEAHDQIYKEIVYLASVFALLLPSGPRQTALAATFLLALTLLRLFLSASISFHDLRRHLDGGRDNLLAGNLGVDDLLQAVAVIRRGIRFEIELL